MLFVATGNWDMILRGRDADCCCEQVAHMLHELGRASIPNTTLRVLNGFNTCPTCGSGAADCGHWPAAGVALTRKTHACAPRVAAAADYVYFDPQA